METSQKAQNTDIKSDPVPEHGWERHADQRTHYENRSHQGVQNAAPAKRRVGAWIAVIVVSFVVVFLLIAYYRIP